MRIYGVDPEVTPVTHLVDCPFCTRKEAARATLLLGESVETRCRHCGETLTVQWAFDEGNKGFALKGADR